MEASPRAFLKARWVQLAMLNYAVDPAILADLVPAGTQLDFWEGKTFVSVVGFRFQKARLFGLPIPFHQNFEEVNLRFYVLRHTDEGVRRGVVFIKEIVPRTAVAWVASTLYNENFLVAAMRHQVSGFDSSDPSVLYEWQTDRRWNRLAVRGSGLAALPDESSEEAYVVEHYWAYSRQRNGSTFEYKVEHRPWRVWHAAESSLDCDVESLYGADFVHHLAGPPTSALLADGSEVAVLGGRRIF